MSGYETQRLAERLYFKFNIEFDRLFENPKSARSIIVILRNLNLNIAIELLGISGDENLKNYCVGKIKEMNKFNL
jgi:hypothetical protein